MAQTLPVPYLGSLGVVSAGFSVDISAVPYPGASRFAINFQLGPNVNPRDDVAFHFGVNLRENTVTKNSIFNMQWGFAEMDTNNVFFPGVPFTLKISINIKNFQVYMDNRQMWTFEHRVPPESIKFITIDGEINLLEISNSSMRQSSVSTPYGFNVVPPASAPHSHMSSNMGHPPMNMGSHAQAQPNPHLYPTYNQQSYPSSNFNSHPPQENKKKGILNEALGAISSGKILPAVLMGGAAHKAQKKVHKSDKKMYKKALKYGLPIAGTAVGAYALKKSLGHHHNPFKFKHGSSSSSSSSSSSDSD